MPAWMLTAGLQNLRRQVDTVFPDRDRTSDGTIGDAAHQAEVSGHNPDDTPGSRPEWNGDPDSTPEVRAWDMDSDLAPGFDCQVFVDHLRGLPGLSSVLRYMIFNRRIYEAGNGWQPRAYTGASAHLEHVHFSGAYTQAADNNTTFNFRLEEIPVALTSADKTWLAADNDRAANAAAAHLLAVKIGDQANPDRTVGDVLRDLAKLRGVLVGDPKDTANAALPATVPLVKLLGTPATLTDLAAKLDTLVARQP